ncbi:MAG: 2-oxoglutarate dehydrogenase E1 component [Bdellovibrionota bacterium]
MSKEDIANNFRRWGYLQADVDPLGNLPKFPHRDLDSATGAEADKWRKLYCSKVGVEFMHMPYPERCDWVAEKFENFKPAIDQKRVLARLLSAERLETFIHSKYVGSKWFSLEGLTALIPLLDSILFQAAERGVEIAIIGMAHRGRINVLHHSAGQPASSIFACFEDVDPRSVLGSGDTKYHKGATGVVKTPSGKEIRVHLGSNPSHLEAVNPVIMGRVRARQMRLGDQGTGKKVVAILIHGDAAFSGQGVAAESLNFAELEGFGIGGTIHIIANNLIGFTARPKACFSGQFCSDIAKRLAIPIFHVNGDSPEDAVRVGQIVSDYRADFASDVLVDLVGYRRFGHNEMDDPTTTAPVLYEKIKSHPLLHETYAAQIGVGKEELTRMEEEVLGRLKDEHEVTRTITKQPKFATLPDYWDQYVGGFYDPSFEVDTRVDESVLAEISKKITTVPEGFNIHPKIKKGLEQRLEMGLGKKPIDWGGAEALAFGSLLMQGVPVRITGQDSKRATFNQRQAVWYDTATEKTYTPLQHLDPKQGWFEVYDSMLSEAAAVGFEYGFARDFPEALVCWEAQFGDFSNGAQIIIDQFLTAGEDKWSLLSGLVLLLPHGYEGMGPEHSSARLERFLQLGGEDNIQVVYPSTSAQYFHLLRRQVLQKWRKPLVVFTPKSLLRAPAAAAQLSDLTQGRFQQVIDDADTHGDAERILLCTGKIVHELRAEQKKGNHTDTGIIAIEQLYPFPEDELVEALDRYPNAKVLVWVQEEPANMGALFFVKPQLERISGGRSVTTVKRSASASPATGSPKAHAMEQEAIIKFAFAKYQ